MHVPKHALCVWVERRADGKYDAYSLGTYGLDKNGNRYGFAQDPEKEKGYASKKEALQSLMTKYEKSDLGVSTGFEYRVGDRMGLLEIRNGENRFVEVDTWLINNPYLQEEIDRFLDGNIDK